MEKADLGQKKSVELFQMNFASVVFRFFSRLVEVKFFEAFWFVPWKVSYNLFLPSPLLCSPTLFRGTQHFVYLLLKALWKGIAALF